jgi:hypothetical protein
MIRTGPPIKTFGGDAFEKTLYGCSDSPSFPHASSGNPGDRWGCEAFPERDGKYQRRMGSSDLADPRQLLAERDVDDPRAADGGLHQHHPGVITHDFSDNLRVTPKWMFAHAL